MSRRTGSSASLSGPYTLQAQASRIFAFSKSANFFLWRSFSHSPRMRAAIVTRARSLAGHGTPSSPPRGSWRRASTPTVKGCDGWPAGPAPDFKFTANFASVRDSCRLLQQSRAGVTHECLGTPCAKKKPRNEAGLRVRVERRSFFFTRRLETVPAQGVGVGDAHIAASIRAGSGVPFIRLGRVCGI